MRNSSPTKMTRAWHECNTSETKRHECNSSAHKCYTNDMSPTRTTRAKNFDFDNYTSENIFSHPCISYMANERLQGEEQFHSKNYLLEMPCHHAKMSLKSFNFVMAKAISKVIR